MPSATFSGHSGYRLDATATRSGDSISVKVTVVRTSTFEAWSTAQQNWHVNIDGVVQNDTWTYDFRTSTSKVLGTKSRGGLAVGSRSWSATVFMASGIGSATVSGTITIPADTPAAPTFQVVERESDTSHTVRWQRNASVDAPYNSQQVQRQEHTGEFGDWTTVQTFTGPWTSAAAAHHTDTSTRANRAYRYRVAAINSSGVSYSAQSEVVYTTPGTPASVLAESVSATQVRVTVAQSVMHTDYVTELQFSSAGGAWTDLTTLTAGEDSYTWTPPAAASVQVRARVVNQRAGFVGDGLMSGYRNSNIVPLQQPPLAPTKLSPNGVTLDAAQNVVLTWTYTSADTSGQKAYEVERQLQPGGAWVSFGKVTSSAKSHTVTPGQLNKDADYLWRVRTWGVHADPSPWSTPASLRVEDAPVVAVLAPVGSVATSRVTAEWTYLPDQVAWSAELLRESQQLESLSGGTAKQVAFSTLLDNGVAYTVRVRVQVDSGLWSAWASSTFTTNFPVPAAPDFSLGWDQNRGAVLIDIANSGTDAAYNMVFRSYDESEWEKIGDVALNASVSDPRVRLGDEVFYKAIAVSELDTTAESVTRSVFTDSTVGFWSVGQNFYLSQQLAANLGEPPSIDLDTGLAHKRLHYFAGRDLPLEFSGTARHRSGEASFLVGSVAERDQVERMALLPAPHLFRLPDGTFLYASVEPVSIHREADGAYSVQLALTEVAYVAEPDAPQLAETAAGFGLTPFGTGPFGG